MKRMGFDGHAALCENAGAVAEMANAPAKAENTFKKLCANMGCSLSEVSSSGPCRGS
ncbi:MAG TPA: hypothetical protein PKC22_15340 [Rhodocyclaceae bacterium]|nr:hypothetical protein [Rhodocyclaceae bacterium]